MQVTKEYKNVLNRITYSWKELIDHTFKYVILDKPLFEKRIDLGADFAKAMRDYEKFDKNLRFED